MNTEVLQAIFVDQLGASQDGDRYVLPDDARVTVLVSDEGDVVPVSRVGAFAREPAYVVLSTETGRFFVEPEHIFAVKSDEDAKIDNRPGFHGR